MKLLESVDAPNKTAVMLSLTMSIVEYTGVSGITLNPVTMGISASASKDTRFREVSAKVNSESAC